LDHLPPVVEEHDQGGRGSTRVGKASKADAMMKVTIKTVSKEEHALEISETGS